MKFGISELSIIPLRKEASNKSEMTNQILFGEHFQIIEHGKEWSKIRLSHDNYEGWVSNKQWTEISDDEFEKLNKEVSTISIDIFDILKNEDTYLPIVIGSVLPRFKSGHAIINEKMYSFDGLSTQGFVKKNKLIENALIYMNAPYLWGGRSPLGIDCSGFTQIVYRLQGIDIPRDAYQQAEYGKTIESLNSSSSGDLAFFSELKNKITHVGILINKNEIIHASGRVKVDKITKDGIINKSGKLTHNLVTIKNII